MKAKSWICRHTHTFNMRTKQTNKLWQWCPSMSFSHEKNVHWYSLVDWNISVSFPTSAGIFEHSVHQLYTLKMLATNANQKTDTYLYLIYIMGCWMFIILAMPGHWDSFHSPWILKFSKVKRFKKSVCITQNLIIL